MEMSRAYSMLSSCSCYLFSVKRDLLQCQKRPTTVSKETHYSVKRDPLREIDRGERGITGRQRRERETEERERDRGERETENSWCNPLLVG